MVARLRLVQARIPPQGWLDVLRQFLLFKAAYLGHRIVRDIARGETAMVSPPPAHRARHRIVSVLWLLCPFLIAFVIVATAIHFIFDALLGALTAAVSAWAARWLARMRPAAWRFSPASASAG